MKYLATIAAVLCLACHALGQRDPNPSVPTSSYGRALIKKPSIQAMRDYLSITNGGGGGLSSNEVYQIVMLYGGGTNGGGGVVSNGTATLVISTWYTNTSANSLWVIAAVNLQGGAAINAQCRVDVDFSPPDGTADWWRRVVFNAAATGDVFTDVKEISVVVPPGAAFQFLDDSTSGAVVMDNVSQLIYLGGTNSGGSSFNGNATNLAHYGKANFLDGPIVAASISATNTFFDTGNPVSIGTNNASGATLNVQGNLRAVGSPAFYLPTDASHTIFQTTTGGPAFLSYSVSADTLVFDRPPIGDGSGFTNIAASGIAKLAGTATNTILHGRVTLQNTNNSLGSWTNDSMVIDRGAIFLPSAGWSGDNTENTWGGRIIWDFFGGSRFYNEAGGSSPMGLIGAWQRWGGAGDNPWLKVTCANVRIEEGWSSVGFGKHIHLGNEDHFGTVTVNYTPVWNSGAVQYNTLGRGHPIAFQTAYTIGAGGYLFSTPGIQSVAGGPGYSYGPGGDTRTLGELWFFSGVPIPATANVSNVWDAYPGVVTAKMHTNSWEFLTPVIAGSSGFVGSGNSLTNFSYAMFQETLASAASPRFIASASFTNIIFTTNSFNSDTSALFTQSNSFLIVNAAGAGTYKVRSSIVTHNNADANGSGAQMSRIYRWNNSPAGLAIGQGTQAYYYSAATLLLNGVVTLAAGDIIALQVYSTTTANTTVGKSQASGDTASVAFLEFERK